MEFLPGFAPDLPEVPEDGAGGVEWYTPRWFLDIVGPIALDPCYSHASLVQAAANIDLRRGEDGLSMPWCPVGDGVIFTNPPFSNTSAWLRKCRVEAERLQRVVVALVPALPGDNPWHVEVWPFAPIVGYIAGRMDFVNPDGRFAEKGRGHAVILFGPVSAVVDVCLAMAKRAQYHPQAPVWTQRVVPAEGL